MICRSEYYAPAMRDLLKDPDEFLAKNDVIFIKNRPGDTTTVAVLPIDNNKYVIKRYNQKGFWHGVKRLLRQSRALRSWNNSHYLEEHGIPTAKPIALLIKRFGPIRKETYFISEYINGLRGKDVFSNDNLHEYNWKTIIKNICLLLNKLHAAKLSHDDFQHNNMIFVNNVPFLLDLDHMRIHKYNSIWFRHNFQKDIDNFLRVLLECNPMAQKMAIDILQTNK